MRHKHHIVPKHMGGTDDPSNIVELTIQEHADAHNLLYALYKNPYDKIAERCLLGWIDAPEASRLALAEAGKKTLAIRTARGDDFGKGLKRLYAEGWIPNHNLGKKYPPKTDVMKQNSSTSAKNRVRGVCPYCNKESDMSNLKRWHMDNCKEVSKCPEAY